MELQRVSFRIPKKPTKNTTSTSAKCKIIESSENPVEVPVEGILLDILSQIYDERKSA